MQTAEQIPLPPRHPDDKLSAAQTAEYVGVAKQTWDSWVALGKAPKPDYKLGSANNSPTRWRRSTIDAWLEQFEPDATGA